MNNRVNHPNYYQNGPSIILSRDYKEGETIQLECIDVIRDMPTWKGNVFKYLWRAGCKSEEGLNIYEKTLEDMQKAEWYLKDKIEELKKQHKYESK